MKEFRFMEVIALDESRSLFLSPAIDDWKPITCPTSTGAWLGRLNFFPLASCCWLRSIRSDIELRFLKKFEIRML